MIDGRAMLIACLVAVTPVTAALAQANGQGEDRDQTQVSPPQAPNGVGGNSSRALNPDSLSKSLSRSGGVIKPPPVNDPNVKTPPPVGDTPVISPPGTPGGNEDIQPK
jgi:hypothetical protein